jgi:hypothetical protein
MAVRGGSLGLEHLLANAFQSVSPSGPRASPQHLHRLLAAQASQTIQRTVAGSPRALQGSASTRPV